MTKPTKAEKKQTKSKKKPSAKDTTKKKNKGGRPTTYKPEYCEKVIALGKEGKSQVQIACNLGIPRASLHDWSKAHPVFSASLARAKAEEQNWWENEAQLNLKNKDFHANLWVKSMAARFKEDYTPVTRHGGDKENPLQIETTDKSPKQIAEAVQALILNASEHTKNK